MSFYYNWPIVDTHSSGLYRLVINFENNELFIFSVIKGKFSMRYEKYYILFTIENIVIKFFRGFYVVDRCYKFYIRSGQKYFRIVHIKENIF